MWFRRHRLPDRTGEFEELQEQKAQARERLRHLAEKVVPEAAILQGEMRAHRTRNHLGEKAELALRARYTGGGQP